jgi:hypothetical protein
MTALNGNGAARQPRRRRSPTVSLTASRRALIAATLVDRGIPARQACDLCCVSAAYTAKARSLSEADRFRLLRGEISLAQLCNGHKPKPKPEPQTLADHLAHSSAAEKVEAAKRIGVNVIWDSMFAPVITEERASQQAAE